MKVLKLMPALLAAIWTMGVLTSVLKTYSEHRGGGLSDMAAGFAAVAICVAITACLFQWAFKKPAAPADDNAP